MRSSTVAPLALLALFAPAPAAAAAPPAARSADAVRAEATKLYRARRYEAACKKFGEAAKLAPEDPAIAADLGLCLMKMNDAEPARAETLRAIRLARPGGPRDDAKTRRNAYYNLKQLGVSIAVPKEGTCGALAVAEGCDRPVYACVYSETQAGAQQGEDFDWVSLGLTSEGAKPACADVEDRFRVRNPPACSESNPPLPFAENSPSAAGEPSDRATLGLSSLEWFTAAAVEHGASDPRESRCTVLVADACLGLVALGCDESGGGKKDRVDVAETVLVAPKP